jgi:hypothetical protein
MKFLAIPRRLFVDPRMPADRLQEKKEIVMRLSKIRKVLCHTIYGAIIASILPLASTCVLPSVRKPPDDSRQRIPSEIQARLQAGKYEVRKHGYKIFDVAQQGLVPVMQGFSLSNSPGDPMLPIRIYEIAVPPDIDWTTLRLSFDLEGTITLPEKYDIIPSPPMRARVGEQDFVNWGQGKNIVDGKNMNVYEKDAFFPEQPVRIVSQSQLRKWKIVKLEFYPLQYNPFTRALRIQPSARVKLDFSRIGKEEYRTDPILEDSLMDTEAESRFLNIKEALEWYRAAPSQRRGTGADYVIITTNAIRDASSALGDFVANKIALGHSVRIVTENDYGVLTGQAPNGRAEKIRQWLMENYIGLCIRYVLLIGNPDPDDGDVPMKMTWPNRDFFSDHESPTDYFYADLTGNWDLDGDGYFGEETSVNAAQSPDPSVGPDTFSVRWTGRIQADTNGGYAFLTASDNGVRLVIDGNTVIDSWTSHELRTDTAWIPLTAGQHDITIEYYEDTGDAAVYLAWMPPGYGYNLVPESKLFHLSSGSYVSGGLQGEYFDNMDFTHPVFTRVDPQISFFWGSGDNGPGGVDFEPEVFVGRIPVYKDIAALDSILRKTISYGNQARAAWRNTFLTADVELWNDQSDYQMSEALKSNFADPLGFTTYRAYEANVTLEPPPECLGIHTPDTDPAAPCNMLGRWANTSGVGLVTWSTHGWTDYAKDLMVSADAVHLRDAVPAFVFQGSCLNGYPEQADNLGYALLLHGAVATVSASRVAWTSIFTPPEDPNPYTGTIGNLAYAYASRVMSNRAAGDALFLSKSKVHPDWSWMNKTDFNLYGDPSLRLHQGFSAHNLLKNPNAGLGAQYWLPFGEVFVDGTPCSGPCFAVRNRGYFLQDVAVPPEAIGKYALLIARVSSERINANGSITGLPYLYGYMMHGDRITAYLQGQHMLCSAAVPNKWVPAWGVFPIPKSTTSIRFFLNQAERSGDPQNGSVARFDDVGLYLVEDESSAAALVAEFKEAYLPQ